MKTRFLACSSCSRHVRAGESHCPFCGASAPAAPPLRTMTERLTRAAMHAAGAAGAFVAISDCDGTETRSVAFYGAACIDGSCGTVETDSGITVNDAGVNPYDASGTPFYGGACVDGSCIPPADAGKDAPDGSTDSGTDSGDAAASDAGDEE